MKKSFFGFMLVLVTMISGCVVPGTMIVKNDQFSDLLSVKPKPGKSALVVAKTNHIIYTANWVNTYLDKKLIGAGTVDKGYFSLDSIEPGEHYFITKASNPNTFSTSIQIAKINFEMDKVYYIRQIPAFAHLVFEFDKPDSIINSCKNDCSKLEYDKENPGSDLDEKEYVKAINEYEEDVRKGEFKEHKLIKGVEVKK